MVVLITPVSGGGSPRAESWFANHPARGVPRRVPRTLVGVRSQRQIVDYALQRRALLADVYAGRVGVSEVCDASPYLLRAARFHGAPAEETCPVCRKERLTEVCWVFGDGLKHMSGSARTPDELARMDAVNAEFSVYVVEVCRTCNWNHLVQSYVLGTSENPGAPGSRARGRSRRTANQ